MKPTGRVARLWPDDATGYRALVSVRWRALQDTPARRPRVPLPVDRAAAVSALFAQTLFGTRRAGHNGVEAPAPGAARVLRVFPIVPYVAPEGDPPALG